MTAPTPIMMPSIVRIDRILFRSRARKAIWRVERRSIVLLVLQRRHRLDQFRSDRSSGNDFVAADRAVAENETAPGEIRDVGLVSHQNDRKTLVVECLENLHHLHGSSTIQVSR